MVHHVPLMLVVQKHPDDALQESLVRYSGNSLVAPLLMQQAQFSYHCGRSLP